MRKALEDYDQEEGTRKKEVERIVERERTLLANSKLRARGGLTAPRARSVEDETLPQGDAIASTLPPAPEPSNDWDDLPEVR